MGDLFNAEPPPPDPSAVYLRVAVERGIHRARSDDEAPDPWSAALTYRLPPGLSPPQLGQRVEVPLGKGDASEWGFVVAVGGAELCGPVPPSRVKSIRRLTPATLPPALVELARWMASYYVCPLGMVFASMLPAAVKHGTGLVRRSAIEVVDAAASPPEGLRPSARAAWDAILSLGLTRPVDAKALARRAGLRNVGPINQLITAGLLRRVEIDAIRARAPLWQRYRVDPAPHPEPVPTPDQARAAEGIAATLGTFSTHVVLGVTGSGKTEVYMNAIRRALAVGRQALVLVPEIALTPQTAGRFIDRFAQDDQDAVAVLHSGLTASERHRQWLAAGSPRCRLVIGARSAVFAPLPRLGIIVVDEEHAGDYKQDQLPRYHARDVAIKRAQLEGCPVVLGSATPSMETWANAQPGPGGSPPRARLWELPRRVGGGSMPRVEIVDLSRASADRPVPAGADAMGMFWLSPRLIDGLSRALRAGEQAILLLNRRGFASTLRCPSATCGWVLCCDDCDSTMVLHRSGLVDAGPIVRCHHCLAERTVPRQCPACGRGVQRLGAGTQRIEECLVAALAGDPATALVPGQTLARVDGDTMRGAADYFDLLARFGRGEVRVILGTQMVAKGLDFPNVTLVGVINADTGLSLPDFRAAERTFQLVSQVAGRAGRGDRPGTVIVQTLNPSEPAIVLASRHDFRAFATRELEIRRRAALPPATRMVRIVVRDRDEGRAAARARELAELLASAGGKACAVVGPAPAPIARIAGFWRMQIEATAPRAAEIQSMLRGLAERGLLTSDARTAVDIDPVALL